jgi:hypothetical protein
MFGIKPNFLGLGAAKSGTTKLATLLRQHPDVFIPKKKGLHFFDQDEAIGIHDLSWYFSQFKKKQSCRRNHSKLFVCAGMSKAYSRKSWLENKIYSFIEKSYR